jgi:hypothetical protein
MWLQLRYRLFGRCWACHRRVVLHSPRQLRRCEDTPLAAEVVVPESHVLIA